MSGASFTIQDHKPNSRLATHKSCQNEKKLFAAKTWWECPKLLPYVEGWISIMFAIIQLVDSLISLYLWCLFIFVILTWLIHFGVVNTQNRLVYLVVDFLYKITDPVLRPIRTILPNLGGIDISPIILVLALIFIRNLIVVDLAKLM